MHFSAGIGCTGNAFSYTSLQSAGSKNAVILKNQVRALSLSTLGYCAIKSFLLQEANAQNPNVYCEIEELKQDNR